MRKKKEYKHHKFEKLLLEDVRSNVIHLEQKSSNYIYFFDHILISKVEQKFNDFQIQMPML